MEKKLEKIFFTGGKCYVCELKKSLVRTCMEIDLSMDKRWCCVKEEYPELCIN